MILSCMGHAKFLLELDNGLRLLTDPYDASCGYPVTPVPADVMLVTHGHGDHSAVETVPGKPMVIRKAGAYPVAPGVMITAVEAAHDDQGGKLRGKNLLFLIQAEGLRVAHLGDLGHLPTREQVDRFAPLDVLMLPVGGHYTIDAQAARETARMLQARIILPMHYQTRATAGWPIRPVSDFIALFDEPAEELDLLRIERGDLSCQPRLAILRPQSMIEAL